MTLPRSPASLLSGLAMLALACPGCGGPGETERPLTPPTVTVVAPEDVAERGPSDDLCASDVDPGPSAGPGCVHRPLACGEQVLSTTKGGTAYFDIERYERSYCFPRSAGRYGGPERVFAFELAKGQQAEFSLESPCGALALVVLRWERREQCPTASDIISECEASPGSGGGSARVWNNKPSRYLVVVDGEEGEGVPFRLGVTCTPENP